MWQCIRFSFVFFLMFFLSMTCGCFSIGPKNMQSDRFDYVSAIGDSWKEQVLLNIVRIRYDDWPSFVAVDKIASAYILEHTGTAKFTSRRWWGSDPATDLGETGYIGKYSDKPTLLYKPITGRKYVTAMLTPTRPISIMALMESGWPADFMSRIAIYSVNGHDNARTEFDVEHNADTGFADFTRVLRKLQKADAFKIRLVKKQDKRGHLELIMNPQRLDSKTKKEFQDLKVTLGLDVNRNRFKILRHTRNADPGVLTIKGRSMGQLLSVLSHGVDIPDEHVVSGEAPPRKTETVQGDSGLPSLMRVRSGPDAPDETYVTVKYRDMSYWIDISDTPSKRSMLYVMTLMNLLESDDDPGGQVVITVD